jgi:hypothetical protein
MPTMNRPSPIARAACKTTLKSLVAIERGAVLDMLNSEKPDFSRTWIPLRPLFFHLPDDIPAREMKVHATRDVLSNNLGACRRSEGGFVVTKKHQAIPGLRAKPQQRPERAAMHHAEALMVIRFKGQSVNVVAPGCRILTAVQMVCSGQVDHLPADPLVRAGCAVRTGFGPNPQRNQSFPLLLNWLKRCCRGGRMSDPARQIHARRPASPRLRPIT